MGCSIISKPPTVTVPAEGGMNPVIMRMVVDLPAPFGPRKPSTSPRSTENETPSTARFVPRTALTRRPVKASSMTLHSRPRPRAACSYITASRVTCKDMCSRAIWLKGGRINAIGPAMNVCKAYEFEVWRQGFLMDLTEGAFYIAVRHGIQGSLLGVELDLYRAFRLVIRRRSGAR